MDLSQLRIYGTSEIELSRIIQLLKDLEVAYNSVYTFIRSIDKISKYNKQYALPFISYYHDYYAIHKKIYYKREADYFDKYVSSMIFPGEQIKVIHISFLSPGFWDFLGSLNVLEVIRKYLCDRHERRKDIKYKELAEKEKLDLDNELLKCKVISEKIKIAEKVGIDIHELAPLLNEFLYQPLHRLNAHQDEMIISNAELLEITKKDDITNKI